MTVNGKCENGKSKSKITSFENELDVGVFQDYHSELVKLGYEIINHEDGTGYISDPDGKLLAEWDKKDDCYRWAGSDNGGLWLANDDDWPDFEKEIYLTLKKEEKEIRIAQG